MKSPLSSPLALALLATATCFSLSGCSGDGSDDADGAGAAPGDLPPGGIAPGSGSATGVDGGGGTTGVPPGSGGGFGTGGAAGTGPTPDKLPVFGYVYNLELDGGAAAASQLPFQNVDYVVHAFVTADASGNVVPVDYFEDYRAALVTAAHTAGKKVILSLGGAGSTWQMAEIIGTPAQDTFIANVAAKIEEWGYDGVDFDFEFPGNNCTPAEFTDFLTRLKTAVKANNPNHLVMFGISPGWWLGSYEWANLASVADLGFYFCYDWNPPYQGPITHAPATPLWGMQNGDQIEPSCRGAVDYIASKGFPTSKLVMGLPFSSKTHVSYRDIPEGVKTTAPDMYTMEVGPSGWTNVASIEMKASALLDPAKSVLSGGAVGYGAGFWEWGQENVLTGADLSTALKARLDSLK